MPFTEPQLETITEVIKQLNEKLSIIISSRDQILGLTNQMHDGFASNAELMSATQDAKLRAKQAAVDLSAILT